MAYLLTPTNTVTTYGTHRLNKMLSITLLDVMYEHVTVQFNGQQYWDVTIDPSEMVDLPETNNGHTLVTFAIDFYGETEYSLALQQYINELGSGRSNEFVPNTQVDIYVLGDIFATFHIKKYQYAPGEYNWYFSMDPLAQEPPMDGDNDPVDPNSYAVLQYVALVSAEINPERMRLTLEKNPNPRMRAPTLILIGVVPYYNNTSRYTMTLSVEKSPGDIEDLQISAWQPEVGFIESSLPPDAFTNVEVYTNALYPLPMELTDAEWDNALQNQLPMTDGVCTILPGYQSANIVFTIRTTLSDPDPSYLLTITNSTPALAVVPIDIHAGDTIDFDITTNSEENIFRASTFCQKFNLIWRDNDGARVIVALNMAGNRDCYLQLVDATGTVVLYNDDGGGSGNSLMQFVHTAYQAPYSIIATTYSTNATGSFTITVTAPDAVVAPTFSIIDPPLNVDTPYNLNPAQYFGVGSTAYFMVTRRYSDIVTWSGSILVEISGDTSIFTLQYYRDALFSIPMELSNSSTLAVGEEAVDFYVKVTASSLNMEYRLMVTFATTSRDAEINTVYLNDPEFNLTRGSAGGDAATTITRVITTSTIEPNDQGFPISHIWITGLSGDGWQLDYDLNAYYDINLTRPLNTNGAGGWYCDDAAEFYIAITTYGASWENVFVARMVDDATFHQNDNPPEPVPVYRWDINGASFPTPDECVADALAYKNAEAVRLHDLDVDSLVPAWSYALTSIDALIGTEGVFHFTVTGADAMREGDGYVLRPWTVTNSAGYYQVMV